uniref:protein NATD1 n=1 Tax=Ictidomys tridecemlineatus TaxID=43179 RepID=UPI001A9EB0FB|nr:protein NATD1 [Ictidomys tridecemlineatus]
MMGGRKGGYLREWQGLKNLVKTLSQKVKRAQCPLLGPVGLLAVADRASTCLPLPSSGCHDRAVLLYEYVGKRIVDLQHTEVPDAYRGRGIAKHLAKAALDFVVEEDLKAHLTCWYIQKYVKENPLPQYLERLQP